MKKEKEQIEEILNLNFNPFYCNGKYPWGKGIMETKIKLITKLIYKIINENK